MTYKGIPKRLTADFSTETLQARREWQDMLKVMKREGGNCNQDYSIQQGSHSDSKEKSKTLQTSKNQHSSAPPYQLYYKYQRGFSRQETLEKEKA